MIVERKMINEFLVQLFDRSDDLILDLDPNRSEGSFVSRSWRNGRGLEHNAVEKWRNDV